MFHKLLVPLDGSGFGEDILPFVRTLARVTGADVALAHVHVPHVPDHLISNTQYQYEGVDLGEYDGRDRDYEKEYLESVAERLDDAGEGRVYTILLEGRVPDAIDEYAGAHEEPGMIAMTTHGRSGFSRAWLGSVADAVVRHSPWPVLLVRPRQGEGIDEVDEREEGDDGDASASEARMDHILVPLDGSPRAERILPRVVNLATATGATVELLEVVTPTAAMGTRVLPVSEAAMAEARRRANEYLGEMSQRLRSRGVDTVHRIVEDSHPARVVLNVVEESRPDLVAMATHGYRGVTRAVLGSVADKVIRGCGLPVLLLGPGVEA